MMQRQPTRRWVMQLAGGTVLKGFSGAPGRAAQPLPAGLYLPSTDHVAHVLKAAGSARPLAGYAPQFFSAEEFGRVRRIIVLLLGDMPLDSEVIGDIASWIDLIVYDSAAVRAAANSMAAPQRALAIAYYGEGAVRDLETSDLQQICRRGLGALAAEGGARTDEGLRSMLERYLDRPATDSSAAVAVFLSFLKKKAFEGYYTSKQGLRELDFKGNSFFAESPGCTHPAGSHG